MWTLLLLLVYATPKVFSAPAESTSSTVRCYDCHYDPRSLEQKDDGSWSSTGSGGFPRCALMNHDDHDFLNKYGCTKGKCFIRRDPNGQVFRGCADPWNLPWGVDTENNCKQQQDKSVWWFCEGELCNDGKIDDGKRCEDLPKLEGKEKEKNQQKEDYGYEQREQNVYQPAYYEEEAEENYREPSASISVTVGNYGEASNQDPPPVSAYDENPDASLPRETVYDLQEDKGSDIYNDDSTSVGYGDNDNVYYSRTQGKYVSYGNEGPAHYYTDSELSHNTDINFNTYDYVLPDDYGRPTEPNKVEAPVDPAPEGYYPDLYEPEPVDPATTYEEYYPETGEVAYEDTEYKGEGIPIDGPGFHAGDGTLYSYDNPTPSQDKPLVTESYDSPIPQDWYNREEAELANNNFPYGWHPYFFPWFYGQHANDYKSEEQVNNGDHVTTSDEKLAWNGEPYEQEYPKTHDLSPEDSHAAKKSSPPEKNSGYEQPKKSHPPAKKSSYQPSKKSHPPTKKSGYESPKKSHPPPKKSSYEPPKKSQPPPKKSSYQPSKKSHPPPKKSSYEPSKKSHPPPKMSSYQPSKKSHPPPKKSSYESPKKSHPPPKKSSYQPSKKSNQPTKKGSYEPPKKSHPPPKKSYQPSPKKSQPAPKKSYVSPKKSHTPSKGKTQQSTNPGSTAQIADSSSKVFEPENHQTRDQNTAYSLGGNLHVRDSTLIHVDDKHQDGVNAYVEVDHDNVDYGKEFDDDTVYYDYEPNTDDEHDTNNAGTGDLYDPNSVTDDTEYYYEYSHEIYTPSENVKNMCSNSCGLYPHPDTNAQFVQCGPGVHYGKSCDCCHPYEHTCSEGTSFDAFIGVCSQGSDTSNDHASYKSVDYY